MQNHENTLGKAQEVENMRKTLERINKQARIIAGIMVLYAVMNIFLGMSLTLSPSFLGAMFPPSTSFVFIILGLTYLGLSVGVYRHNRACAVITMVVLFADMVFSSMSGNILSHHIIGTIMRSLLVIGALHGLFCCFKYHTLVKAYKMVTNEGGSGHSNA